MSYGYPVEGPNPTESVAVARLFSGSYQRFFPYTSLLGYLYFAGELSIPAPGGLSGGPVFRPTAASMLTGIVTETHESYAIADWEEVVEQDGTTSRTEARKILNYGIVLMLSAVSDWLISEIPPRQGAGWLP